MARINAKIVGKGKRMQGVSAKTNKPYDFQRIVFAFDDPYIEGINAFGANVPGVDIDALGTAEIGTFVDLVYHSHNNQFYVDAIIG